MTENQKHSVSKHLQRMIADLARKNGIILIDGKGLAEVIVNFFDDEKLEIIRRQLGVSKIYIPYTGVYEY